MKTQLGELAAYLLKYRSSLEDAILWADKWAKNGLAEGLGGKSSDYAVACRQLRDYKVERDTIKRIMEVLAANIGARLTDKFIDNLRGSL
jgi:hypothetical protein